MAYQSIYFFNYILLNHANLCRLSAVLGPSIQEGHQTITMCPEEDRQGGERSQGQDL